MTHKDAKVQRAIERFEAVQQLADECFAEEFCDEEVCEKCGAKMAEKKGGIGRTLLRGAPKLALGIGAAYGATKGVGAIRGAVKARQVAKARMVGRRLRHVTHGKVDSLPVFHPSRRGQMTGLGWRGH